VSLAAAAAVLIVAVGPRITPRFSKGAIAGLDALAAEDRQRVEAALAAGVAEPPDLAELRGQGGVLMGGSPAPRFGLGEPVATVVASDRPTFRWRPLAGAADYTVVIADEGLQPVARSEAVTSTSWTPRDRLPRGRVYLWQVTARQGDTSVTAPAPDQPPARFRVLDERTAALLDRVARERPDAHLLLGLLYAQAGVIAEAAAHLRQVPDADPHAATARRTLERLQPAE
jgi:hypothetical protein